MHEIKQVDFLSTYKSNIVSNPHRPTYMLIPFV
jgi:hypothetical protein